MYTLLSIFIALAIPAISAQYQYLNDGDTCVSFAGPSEIPCQPDHLCCPVAIDYSVCYNGDSCPPSFIEEGGLCKQPECPGYELGFDDCPSGSGIAGPSPLPCWPGTTCCSLGPDHSICASEC